MEYMMSLNVNILNYGSEPTFVFATERTNKIDNLVNGL
jgi:hypothetical protein